MQQPTSDTTTSPPLRLSDAQMDALLAAAHPLAPASRNAFLEDCARELALLPEIGDGSLHRVVMEIQRRHFSPPQFVGSGHGHHASKYERV